MSGDEENKELRTAKHPLWSPRLRSSTHNLTRGKDKKLLFGETPKPIKRLEALPRRSGNREVTQNDFEDGENVI